MPKRLKYLQHQYRSLDEIWDYLEENKDIYTAEIEWVTRMWDWRLNGLWIMINGKPTYMDGWHFFYCGFWTIDIGLPQYRDRDRRWFIAARFFFTEEVSAWPLGSSRQWLFKKERTLQLCWACDRNAFRCAPTSSPSPRTNTSTST